MPQLTTAGSHVGGHHEVACYFPARFDSGSRVVHKEPFMDAMPSGGAPADGTSADAPVASG
jgi:hypothetical protein